MKRTALNRVQFLKWPETIKDAVYSGEYENALLVHRRDRRQDCGSSNSQLS